MVKEVLYSDEKYLEWLRNIKLNEVKMCRYLDYYSATLGNYRCNVCNCCNMSS